MVFIESLTVALLLSVLVLNAYVLHKARRIHLMQYDLMNQHEIRIDNHYLQIQAFISLDRLLQLPWALPPLRGAAGSPDFLLLLAEHVIQNKPEVIVECSSGSSTIVLAQCAKLNKKGHIFSLEHDEKYAQQTREELIKQGLQDWATVIDAPLKSYLFSGQKYNWYTVNEHIDRQNIDMLVIDGPPAGVNHCARYPAGPLLLPLLNKDATVFMDDTNRPDEQEIIRRWINEFPHLKAKEHYCEKGAFRFDNQPYTFNNI